MSLKLFIKVLLKEEYFKKRLKLTIDRMIVLFTIMFRKTLGKIKILLRVFAITL